jgi:four helix bundle protein
MAAIKSFRDLEVYRLGLEESRKIFLLTKGFPNEERFALIDQIRRSSRIAEGWARRRYPPAFVNKTNEALGEAMETQAWLDHALACSYISAERHRELDEAWQHIGAMLNRMIEKQADFCRSAGRLQ